MPKHIDSPPDELSKTQRKKDMTALQKLGETLIGLSASQLEKIPMPDNLRDSLELARSLKSHESIRRQLQYIGKIMRNLDPEPIQIALNKIKIVKDVKITQFHAIEKWRDLLIAEGDSGLQKFMEAYPQADRQNLRQLIRNAQHDIAKNKNSGAATELFKYIKNIT